MRYAFTRHKKTLEIRFKADYSGVKRRALQRRHGSLQENQFESLEKIKFWKYEDERARRALRVCQDSSCRNGRLSNTRT